MAEGNRNDARELQGGRDVFFRAGAPLRRNQDDNQWDDDGEDQIIHGHGRGNPNIRRIRENQHNGDRARRKRALDSRFLRQLEACEPSDVVITLSNPNTEFREALLRCVQDPSFVKDILRVLAIAVECDSMPENLNRLFVIMREVGFYDTSLVFFLDMQNEQSVSAQKEFAQPIKDMIKLIQEINIKTPNYINQFVGIHACLQSAIDGLLETSSVIDDEILKSFREFTEQKNKLMTRYRRTKVDVLQQQAGSENKQEPPEDFREIEIFPQRADMQTNNEPFLRVNRAKGAYDDVDHYLDVQFRLLREYFIGPLRSGIADYMHAIQERGKHKTVQDVRIYHSVRVIAPVCSDSGLCHVLQFDVSRLHKVRWAATKRLIYGSLVCLSPDNFQTYYFATVQNRELKDLAKGYIQVRFEHDQKTVKSLFNTVFTMAETTAYFESYRHVLAGLQRTRPDELSFDRYIVDCTNHVDAPSYLRRHPDAQFDLRPLVDEDIVLTADSRLENLGKLVKVKRDYKFSSESKVAEKVDVLKRDAWPPASLLHLDPSQLEAIYTALTKEFVIIQGPPGTGKTYIGLKIVKALLHNKDVWSKDPLTGATDPRPMLIVCYTNHALDQFLEGIVQYFKGDVLRIGSRSNSEILKDYNIQNFRQRFRHAQQVPVAVFQERREARDEMDTLRKQIDWNAARIQMASSNILHEDFLQPFMGPAYQLLRQQFGAMLDWNQYARSALGRRHSVIVEWLGYGCLSPIVDAEAGMQPAVQVNQQPVHPEEEAEDELIDVEHQAGAIQAQRDIDFGELDDDIELENMTRKEREVLQRKLEIQSMQANAVALDIDHIGDKPRDTKDSEWHVQKKEKKKMKQKAQRNIASADVMTEDEANEVPDLWRTDYVTKWRLYRMWVQKYCQHLLDEMSEKESEFVAAATRYQEALMQEDKSIMQHATVIGMTTTGAARYQAVLQEIRPRIIVVEEAAEVYEAHVVTTLSRGCEHLILIGDHKQLKPSPTVYKLATDYNLDVSLFERMVTNGMQCDCLELQHRMRPEIAELLHHIYDNLRDHDDVKKYENIKGVSSNLFCINHNKAEAHDDDLRSHSNEFEASYLVGLCRYLLLQGYTPSQITMLTMYSGQLFSLRHLMPKSEFDGVRVTVVDNYQGEENDIILVSLVRSNEDGSIGFLKIDNRVCVALSRAKRGLYIIGNFDCLSRRSTLWKEITIDMRKKGLMGEGLQLYCQNHPDNDGILVKHATDFDGAQDGGCNKKCDFRLRCGHVCQQFCHVMDQEHDNYDCRKQCARIVCANNHRCQKLCYQACDKCTVNVPKVLPQCKHTQDVECHLHPVKYSCKEACQTILSCGHQCPALCGEAHTRYCKKMVDKEWSCGHTGRVACHREDRAVCNISCGTVLTCGHPCEGTCGDCFQGRLHRPCMKECNRILVCGHDCQDNCYNCPPCAKSCDNKCVHSKCGRRCGELCAPCMEPCTWSCEHYTCEKRCSEPCDRPRCDEPCERLLACGHQCIGLCGEPCPADCRECHKEKVTTMLFGTEEGSDARFVLLHDCMHISEVTAMDHYMDMDQNSEDGVATIQLKGCPLCKTPIRKNCRYGNIINQSLQHIEAVKRQMLGSADKITELVDIVSKNITTIEDDIGIARTEQMIKFMKEHKSERTLTAMLNQIEILKEIHKINAETVKLRFVANTDRRQILSLFLYKFHDWVLEERIIMTYQEINDSRREIARCRAHVSLMAYQQAIQTSQRYLDIGLKCAIRSAEQMLTYFDVFTEEKETMVNLCLRKLKELKLTGIREERVMILQAVRLAKGHWYKCPNGHVYTIDWGGANEGSKCPECSACLLHTLAPGKALADEMDGARHAAYSDEANLVIYSRSMPRQPSNQKMKGGPDKVGPRLINISITKDIPLHHAAKAWKPTSRDSDDKKDKKEDVADMEDDAQTADLFKKTRSILNKLTPQKFQTLVTQMQALKIDSESKLKGVIDLVFEKAISEPNFSVAYANMCRCLSMFRVQSELKPGEMVNFRAVLLTGCQHEFEKGKSYEQLFTAKREELEKETDVEKKKMTKELAYEESKAKRRSLGNIRFIGELFKLKMLTENIMHDCVFKLLRSKDPENLECLCRLLSTIGKELETDKAKIRMDQYFNQMGKLGNDKRLSSRVRFMLQDVIELRASKWVPRRADNNPKTIEQIHKEAAQEAQQRALNTQQALANQRSQPRQQGGGGGGGGGQRSVVKCSMCRLVYKHAYQGICHGFLPYMGRRGGPGSQDGWNTVGQQRALMKVDRSIDPSKMKFSKVQQVDEQNIQLGPGGGAARFAGWGRGSTGGSGGRASQEKEKPSVPGDRFSALSKPDDDARNRYGAVSPSRGEGRGRGGFGRQPALLSGRPSQEQERKEAIAAAKSIGNPLQAEPVERGRAVEAGRSRSMEQVPAVNELSADEAEKKTRAIVDEYLHIQDIKPHHAVWRDHSREAQGGRPTQPGFDFTPLYMRMPGSGGGGGGGGGGCGSRSMPRQPSNQKMKGGPDKVGPRLINISITKDISLHHAEKAWKPTHKDTEDKKDIKDEDVADVEEEAQTAELYKKTRSILNKLMPQKFQTLVTQMQALKIDSDSKLKGVIDLVFEKAISEPNFSVAYANMCRCLSMFRVQSEQKPGEMVNFRSVLLTGCQHEFEKDKSSEQIFTAKREELEKETDIEKQNEMKKELAYEEAKAKRRSLGNIRFIGELFKLKMLTQNIMHDCVLKLLHSKDPENLECLCRLLSTIGKELETDKAKIRMDQYFTEMDKLVNDKRLSSRVRFMLQDVIELRASKWVPRRADNNPKTIEHKEAAQEARQRALNTPQALANQRSQPQQHGGGGGGGDGRRGGPGSQDGWNKVEQRASLRLDGSIDFAKMTFCEVQQVDEQSIELGFGGGAARFAGWGRGGSGGLASQEKEKLNAPGNRSIGNPLHAEPVERGRAVEAGRARSMEQELSADEVEKKTRTIIDEYLHIQDIKEAVACVEELPPTNHHHFVTSSLNIILDRSTVARKQTGHLLHDLIKQNHISANSYFKGLTEVLELAEVFEIDVPKIWQYLGEMISPMVQYGSIPLTFLKSACTPLKESNKAGILVAEVLHDASHREGHKQVSELWLDSGLLWSDFVPIDQIEQFLIDKKLEFTKGGDSAPTTPTTGLPMKDVRDKLNKLIVVDKTDNENVFDWIESNVDVPTTKQAQFVRELMTAVCLSAITKDKTRMEVDQVVIAQRYHLLQKYLDHQPESELQALYAVQALITKLEHPTVPDGPEDMSRVPNDPKFTAFVGNLPYDTSEEKIEEFFGQLPVVSVRLPEDNGRFSGFGYVVFETRQALIDAISMTDELFSGRKIRVDLAAEVRKVPDDPKYASSMDRMKLPTAPKASRGPEDMSRVPNDPPFTAFIGNLPYETSEEKIEEFFGQLPVVSVRLPEDNGRFRGFGYVVFETRQALIDAISMTDELFSGRKIRVDLAAEVRKVPDDPKYASSMDRMQHGYAPKASRGPEDMSRVPNDPPFTAFIGNLVPNDPPFTACIGNLSYEASEEKIEEFFGHLPVVSVRLPEDNGRFSGFGYVVFETRQALIDAISMTDELFSGRKIRVDLAGEVQKDDSDEDAGRGEDEFDSDSDKDNDGLLWQMFDILYTEEIISEDAFYQWERSDDEPNGKGVAMKQVVPFFTRLMTETLYRKMGYISRSGATSGFDWDW